MIQDLRTRSDHPGLSTWALMRMTHVLGREAEGDRRAEDKAADRGGRDWSEATTSRGTPEASRSLQTARQAPPLEPWEGAAWACTPPVGVLASRTEMSFKPPGVWPFGMGVPATKTPSSQGPPPPQAGQILFYRREQRPRDGKVNREAAYGSLGSPPG